jgi:biopolymer transport protein ExbD
MRLEQRSRRRQAMIGLTPLIDVVFILLLFFMLASSLTRLHTVPVVVAAGDPAAVPTDDEQPALLRVLAQGDLELDDQPITTAELQDVLAGRRARDPGFRLAVEAEDAVPLQRLLAVLDAAAKAGVPAVRLR